MTDFNFGRSNSDNYFNKIVSVGDFSSAAWNQSAVLLRDDVQIRQTQVRRAGRSEQLHETGD